MQRAHPLRRRWCRLRARLHERRQRLHGQPGPADDYGFEPDEHLRHDTDHHTPLLGIQEQRKRLVVEHATDLLDHRDKLEPPVTADLPVLVLGAVDPNYTISYAPGVVTVDPAPLTITASSPDDDLRGRGAHYHARLLGLRERRPRLVAEHAAQLRDHRHQLQPASPPTYPSTCSGAADSNYTISYVPGAVTVTRPRSPSAVSGGQTYGSTTPTFSGTASPPSGITVNTSGLTCSHVDTSTPIGPALAGRQPHRWSPSRAAVTTLSGTGANDYTTTYTSATNDFMVTPAPLTITASSPTSTYGTRRPSHPCTRVSRTVTAPHR